MGNQQFSGNMKSSLTFFLLATLTLGCGKKATETKSAADARQHRETKIQLETCAGSGSSSDAIDANGDGKPEIVRSLKGSVEMCRTVDLNFDGQVDRTVFYDGQGKERRVESDFDRDGLVDEIATYEAGLITLKSRVTTPDGKLDTWEFFDKGVLSRTERDENGDGIIDQWWEYPSRGCPLIHVDENGDGRPDPGASIDYCKETGYTPPPVPGEAEAAPSPADFGKEGERVEELSNVKEGTDAPSAEGSAP